MLVVFLLRQKILDSKIFWLFLNCEREGRQGMQFFVKSESGLVLEAVPYRMPTPCLVVCFPEM